MKNFPYRGAEHAEEEKSDPPYTGLAKASLP